MSQISHALITIPPHFSAARRAKTHVFITGISKRCPCICLECQTINVNMEMSTIKKDLVSFYQDNAAIVNHQPPHPPNQRYKLSRFDCLMKLEYCVKLN